MPPTDFANWIPTAHDEQVASSDRMWEDRILLLGDDTSPDLLPGLFRRATRTLLEESTRRGVALDWSSLRVHINRFESSMECTLVTRVDVLP